MPERFAAAEAALARMIIRNYYVLQSAEPTENQPNSEALGVYRATE